MGFPLMTDDLRDNETTCTQNIRKPQEPPQ